MKSFALIVAGIACLATSASLGAETSWIHGTWWYADAGGNVLEGDDKDGMVFRSDGTVDLVDQSGTPYLNCVYSNGVPWELSVKCLVRGEVRELLFRIGKDRDKLANTRDTDGGAYVRS